MHSLKASPCSPSSHLLILGLVISLSLSFLCYLKGRGEVDHLMSEVPATVDIEIL